MANLVKDRIRLDRPKSDYRRGLNARADRGNSGIGHGSLWVGKLQGGFLEELYLNLRFLHLTRGLISGIKATCSLGLRGRLPWGDGNFRVPPGMAAVWRLQSRPSVVTNDGPLRPVRRWR
jgi:hypothetical protein